MFAWLTADRSLLLSINLSSLGRNHIHSTHILFGIRFSVAVCYFLNATFLKVLPAWFLLSPSRVPAKIQEAATREGGDAVISIDCSHSKSKGGRTRVAGNGVVEVDATKVGGSDTDTAKDGHASASGHPNEERSRLVELPVGSAATDMDAGDVGAGGVGAGGVGAGGVGGYR